MVTSFVIAALAGVVIGLLSGMLGIGGGMIMIPLFRLGFGMSALASTATSLFTIIPTSISGVVIRLRDKTCVPRLGVALGIGGACSSPAGVWLAQASPSWLVMLAAALVIAYSSIAMFRKALAAPKSPGADNVVDSYEVYAIDGRGFMKAVLIGLATGVASGYVGLGGGFIMVPLMMSLLNMPLRIASGTSLVAITIIALPATIMQCILGNVDYLTGVAVACGSIPGALIGARLVRHVPERALRLAFAAFLCIAAILLVVKEIGM